MARREEKADQTVAAIITAKYSDHPGPLFLPIHFGENRTNVLTNTEASDPLAKIPEFKVSAVNIAKLSE